MWWSDPPRSACGAPPQGGDASGPAKPAPRHPLAPCKHRVHTLSRRRCATVLVGVGLLAGCGFRLRGATTLPFASLRLGFDALSPLGQELRRQLAAVPDLRLVSGTAPAEAVLEVLDDSFTRTVSSRTAAGQVRGLSLTARLRFRLRSAEGEEWLRETTIEQNQLMSYSETVALAKESEEAQLARSMREEIAAQVVRRLAALKR